MEGEKGGSEELLAQPDGLTEPVEAQRRYNRDYMRRWRAAHPEKQDQLNANRKARTQIEPLTPDEMKEDSSVCGFCRARPSTSRVTRLEVSDETESGYREIQVPYCGTC